MAGPRQHVTAGWAALKKDLKPGEVEPVGFYLGCLRKVRSVLLRSGQMARRVRKNIPD